MQVRNTIKALVKSSAIGGEQASLWKKRIEDGEMVAAMRRRAEGGDVEATAWLATCYYTRMNVIKDLAQSYVCYARATDLGHPAALWMHGIFLMHDIGCCENEYLAVSLITRAAGGGSALGALALAQWYDETSNRLCSVDRPSHRTRSTAQAKV